MFDIEMVADQVDHAYKLWFSRRDVLHAASEKVLVCKMALQKVMDDALVGGGITGKNEAERAACGRLLFVDEVEALEQAEAEERLAKRDFEECEKMVEWVRVRLRILEALAKGEPEIAKG